MNHEIKIRFRIVKNRHVIEVLFDERLSFHENFRILNEICNENLADVRVYDPMKRIFLDRDVPLSTFSFQYFVSFYLFN